MPETREPLRSPKQAPAGALIRMTRNSPKGNYALGDMAVKGTLWYADFNGLGNAAVIGAGIHGVAARYYLIVNRNYRKAD